MDPITQGALGAITAGSASRTGNSLRLAVLAGWAGGMLADTDFLIRSANDPLLNIEYHRHFTHSLIFIPLGGLICAALLWAVFRRRQKFGPLMLFSTLGYATAGLLDACTSYGTHLLWPFSDGRVAWNIISIIDPIFTGTILVLLAIGIRNRRVVWMRGALVFALCYLALGVVQNRRASQFQMEVAERRGHHKEMAMATVKPSIGNLVLWRSLYRHGGKFYVDAVRVGLFGPPRLHEGVEVEALTASELKQGLAPESVLAHDLDRFDHFSAGYLAHHPDQPDVVGDLRYSMLPNSAQPLWGIRYDREDSDRHASFESFRDGNREKGWAFLRLLFSGQAQLASGNSGE